MIVFKIDGKWFRSESQAITYVAKEQQKGRTKECKPNDIQRIELPTGNKHLMIEWLNENAK